MHNRFVEQNIVCRTCQKSVQRIHVQPNLKVDVGEAKIPKRGTKCFSPAPRYFRTTSVEVGRGFNREKMGSRNAIARRVRNHPYLTSALGGATVSCRIVAAAYAASRVRQLQF